MKFCVISDITRENKSIFITLLIVQTFAVTLIQMSPNISWHWVMPFPGDFIHRLRLCTIKRVESCIKFLFKLCSSFLLLPHLPLESINSEETFDNRDENNVYMYKNTHKLQFLVLKGFSLHFFSLLFRNP